MYLYPKYPVPITPIVNRKVIQAIQLIIFCMIKEAILKAITHGLIISMLIIIPTVAPLWLVMSYMTRTMVQTQKTP